MKITSTQKIILTIFAIIAFLGPNALYLYTLVTQPEMNMKALENPVAIAFIVEAFMLLGLFLWYVFKTTKSWYKVLFYLVLTFLGSLAFSFPFYLLTDGNKVNKN